MKKIVLLVFSITSLISCKKNDVTNSSIETTSDTVTTAIYKINAFNTVSNQSIVNVEISNEIPRDEIHLISSIDLLNEIKHEIINKELIISQKNKNFTLKNQSQIIVKINSDEISKFNISGLGYIKSSIIQKAKNIETEIEGAGNLELTINNQTISNKIEGLGNLILRGKTNIAKTKIEGAGNLDALELITNTTIVSIDGLGNANVQTTEKLDVTISGIGNLNYKGNPKEIRKNTSGFGSVKKLD